MRIRVLSVILALIFGGVVINANAAPPSQGTCQQQGYDGYTASLDCTAMCPYGGTKEAAPARPECAFCRCTAAEDCKGGSGCFKPVTNKSTKYQTVSTDTSPVVTLQDGSQPFGAIPPCPNDPASLSSPHTQLTKSNDYSPTGYDINEKMAAGGTAPPAQCTVTSVVNRDASNNVTSLIQAVCPDGYAQVGIGKMQPEVIYNTVPDIKEPTTIDQLNSYTAQGYTCDNETTERNLLSMCKVTSLLSVTFKFDVPINKLLEVTAGSSIGSDATGTFPKDGVVKFTAIYAPGDKDPKYSSKCWSSAAGGCTGTTLGGCVPSCSMSYDGISSSAKCTYAVDYWGRVHYEYRYQVCTRPVGFITTGNVAPATLICARINPGYKKVNPR